MNQKELTTLKGLSDLSAVSPEVAMSQPLANLVDSTLKAACRSQHTRRAYQTGIGLFLQYLDLERGDLIPDEFQQVRPLATKITQQLKDKRNRTYEKTAWEFSGPAGLLRLVDAALLDGFSHYRESQGDSPNTANLRVYAARVFLSVALRDGVITLPQGQVLGIEPYKQRQKRDDQPVGRRLTHKEVKRLRAAVDTSRIKGIRDKCILDVMLFAGLRAEECANLDLSNFQQDTGRWWIVLKGKGKKTRKVKVHDLLYQSLDAWLNAAGLQLGDKGCVFLGINKGGNFTGECINSAVVNRLVGEYGIAAGLVKGADRLGPHDLRRSFARNAYDNGASLLMVQKILGHSDPKTTQRYIGTDNGDDLTAVDYVRY